MLLELRWYQCFRNSFLSFRLFLGLPRNCGPSLFLGRAEIGTNRTFIGLSVIIHAIFLSMWEQLDDELIIALRQLGLENHIDLFLDEELTMKLLHDMGDLLFQICWNWAW